VYHLFALCLSGVKNSSFALSAGADPVLVAAKPLLVVYTVISLL
jgi:hypothetical protein